MAKKKNTKTRSTLSYETLPALFTGICDAIREKTGGTALIDHQDIPSQISAIQTGGDEIIALNDLLVVEAYGTGSKSYTVEKAGTLNLIAVATGVGENQMSLSKNGNSVSEYISFVGSSYTTVARSVHDLVVAENDVIAISVSTASYASNCLILAILTPTTS